MTAQLQSQISVLQSELADLRKRVDMLELEKYHDQKPKHQVLREDFLSRGNGVSEGLGLAPAPQPHEADILTYYASE